jgi:predicted nucleotidyltransferase
MSSNGASENPLPEHIRTGLESLCDHLQNIAGGRLISVVLYGGLAKGEYVPDTSDVNVMLVFETVTVNCLDEIAPIIESGARDFRLATMILTETELGRTVEVFPVKFLDMYRHHRVLWGKEVFESLTISREHVRLRCAQEITNLILRLRQFYVQRSHRPELVERTLTRAISSFLTSLNTLTELKTGAAAPTKLAVIDAAVELGLDSRTLRDVFALKRGEIKPDPEELRRLYDLFMITVQQADILVDKV